MSKKSPKIAALLEECAGETENPYYHGYFVCFNRELFYEAHDVLEELWLKDKASPNYSFYKGLIQLAGAFVHLQKSRLKPAVALFNLASANLAKYPETHDEFDVRSASVLIADWRSFIETHGFERNPLAERPAPKLHLGSAGQGQAATPRTS
jgi:hypothetical protein